MADNTTPWRGTRSNNYYTYIHVYIYILYILYIIPINSHMFPYIPMNFTIFYHDITVKAASFSTETHRFPPPTTTPPSPTAVVGPSPSPRRGAGVQQLQRSPRARSQSSTGWTEIEICQILIENFQDSISLEFHFFLRLKWKSLASLIEDDSHSIHFDPLDATVAAVAQSHSFAVANVVATNCA